MSILTKMKNWFGIGRFVHESDLEEFYDEYVKGSGGDDSIHDHPTVTGATWAELFTALKGVYDGGAFPDSVILSGDFLSESYDFKETSAISTGVAVVTESSSLSQLATRFTVTPVIQSGSVAGFVLDGRGTISRGGSTTSIRIVCTSAGSQVTATYAMNDSSGQGADVGVLTTTATIGTIDYELIY